jgi:hypothetical protein
VANQLERFAKLSPPQLAGQVANLDFWLEQTRSALRAIDDYGIRFVRMEGAQHRHRDSPHASDIRRVPASELQRARTALVHAAERFLDRCRSQDLISEDEHASAQASLGFANKSHE